MTQEAQQKLNQETQTETTLLTQPEGTYWHFLREDRRLAHGDGRLVVVGETLTHDGPIQLCYCGFHASCRAIDAVKYAPGPIASLVTLGGTVKHGEDKSVGQERTVVWMYDASRELREFSCDMAGKLLLAERAAGREPDALSFAAIETERRYARGDATWVELVDAYAAAYAAAAYVARADAAYTAFAFVATAAAAASAAFLDEMNALLTAKLLQARAEGKGDKIGTEETDAA